MEAEVSTLVGSTRNLQKKRLKHHKLWHRLLKWQAMSFTSPRSHLYIPIQPSNGSTSTLVIFLHVFLKPLSLRKCVQLFQALRGMTGLAEDVHIWGIGLEAISVSRNPFSSLLQLTNRRTSWNTLSCASGKMSIPSCASFRIVKNAGVYVGDGWMCGFIPFYSFFLLGNRAVSVFKAPPDCFL